MDTVFALSSGSPPAAIAVVRLSGPEAGPALRALAGGIPEPRQASYRRLRDGEGGTLDQALVLWFPGPASATGEDLAELHLHGGRAVVAAVERALTALPGLRRATEGEFTRRAFANGRIDLAEAEGLADLLSAETELQRLSAQALAGGALSRQVEAWREAVLTLSAAVEAVLDFADEDDVASLPPDFACRVETLAQDIGKWLDRPRAEAVRDGFRVVIAGPPNAGKSTLFNALVEDEAAITSPLAGTTRDVLTRAVALAGVPFVFIDTAGLREETADTIEAQGMDRARIEIGRADVTLWLGPEGEGGVGAWELTAKADVPTGLRKQNARHALSAVTGEGLDALRADLVAHARSMMPRPGDVALQTRHAALLGRAAEALRSALSHDDPLIIAEELRAARGAFDSLAGRAATEDMLDALFRRFCIGK